MFVLCKSYQSKWSRSWWLCVLFDNSLLKCSFSPFKWIYLKTFCHWSDWNCIYCQRWYNYFNYFLLWLYDADSHSTLTSFLHIFLNARKKFIIRINTIETFQRKHITIFHPWWFIFEHWKPNTIFLLSLGMLITVFLCSTFHSISHFAWIHLHTDNKHSHELKHIQMPGQFQ